MGDEGGVLHVGLSVISADGTHPPGLTPGRFVRLTVSDTGCGIESSGTEEMFEYGSSSNEDNALSGIGLGIVNGIVKGMDGGITMSSEAGEGRTFNIFLPVHDPGKDQEDILTRFSSKLVRFSSKIMGTV